MVRMRQASAPEVQRLYEAFAQAQDAAAVSALMEDLCTIREVNEMAQRLTMAAMLDAGASYVEVQEVTSASATTIARVSRCLNHGSGGYRRALGVGTVDSGTAAAAGAGTGTDTANPNATSQNVTNPDGAAPSAD